MCQAVLPERQGQREYCGIISEMASELPSELPSHGPLKRRCLQASEENILYLVKVPVKAKETLGNVQDWLSIPFLRSLWECSPSNVNSLESKVRQGHNPYLKQRGAREQPVIERCVQQASLGWYMYLHTCTTQHTEQYLHMQLYTQRLRMQTHTNILLHTNRFLYMCIKLSPSKIHSPLARWLIGKRHSPPSLKT